MIERVLNEKPDFLALTAEKPGFFPALLESQSLNEKIGRYDILFAAPSLELVAFNQTQFEQLLDTVDAQPNNQSTTEGPFQYGWLVYFSYESAYLLEPKLSHLFGESNNPLAVAVYCQGAIVKDRINKQVRLYAQTDAVADAIQSSLDSQGKVNFGDSMCSDFEQADEAEFEQAVVQAKQLIGSGDIYQANLSRQYHCIADKFQTPAAVFSSLRATNPAPFAALLQINDFAVASSSPERLFSIRNGVVETRPIAGTRPRGVSADADLALIEELLNTPKEQAEHIMLIDLERNDMGKVCQTGTVKVDELMVVESYQHVHHIVSNISGKLKPKVSVVDVLKAIFPGGTITGCPKIRCMEVIRDIELADRGCYTGSLGYINHDGQVDLNILIRTVAMNRDHISFSAGAGIVFDSDPTAELQETKHKAQGLINALRFNAFSSTFKTL